MDYRARFLLVVFTAISACCFGQMPLPGSQSQDTSFAPRFSEGGASLAGTVMAATSNTPVSDARVEIRDTNGNVLSSVYTNHQGAFDFGSVPEGRYHIAAFRGISQVEDQVEVHSLNTTVTLRMAVGNQQAGGYTGNTISVAQYKVPEKARSEFEKARQATAKDRLDEAQKHLAKALEIFPAYADALTLRAVMNLGSDTPAAVADLEKAIRSDGNYALAYTVLGAALNIQAKFDQALQALERGQSLAPDSWQGYFEMAKAYIGKTDYQAALRQVEKAQSLVPKQFPTLMLMKAQSLLGLKQYSNAVNELEGFLQKEPHGPNTATAQKMLEEARQQVASK
jgi:tetratricopeptide (TPR) repeat protein